MTRRPSFHERRAARERAEGRPAGLILAAILFAAGATLFGFFLAAILDPNTLNTTATAGELAAGLSFLAVMGLGSMGLALATAWTVRP